MKFTVYVFLGVDSEKMTSFFLGVSDALIIFAFFVFLVAQINKYFYQTIAP